MKKILMITLLFATSIGLGGLAVASDGAAIYKAKCAACHGQNGQGTPGMAPQLAGTDYIKGEAGPIRDTIVNGRTGGDKKYKEFPLAMPKLGVSDADADAITEYLKSL